MRSHQRQLVLSGRLLAARSLALLQQPDEGIPSPATAAPPAFSGRQRQRRQRLRRLGRVPAAGESGAVSHADGRGTAVGCSHGQLVRAVS